MSKAEKGKAIIERIERERGFVREWPRLLAARDPDYLECLHNVVTHALHRPGTLPTKFREMILICVNAFDYYEFGVRIHTRSALKAGATEEELLEALEVVGVLKLHAFTSVLAAVLEEVEAFKKAQAGDAGKNKAGRKQKKKGKAKG